MVGVKYGPQLRRSLSYGGLALALLWPLLPIWWTFVLSIKHPLDFFTAKALPFVQFQPTLAHWRDEWQVFGDPAGLGHSLANSLVIATVTSGINLSPASSGPTLQVNAAAGQHPISPDIYGMNFAAENLAQELHLPVRRWGGNATTRYNWQSDISNHASDWYFENIKESDATALPDDSAVIRFIEQDRRTNTATLLTLPMIGYVSKANATACGFSQLKYGNQTANDWQWRPDCGNGILTNGSLVTGNDPADTSLGADPAFVANWVNYLKGRYGTATNGGIRFYNLDNEADIWFETHRDVFPLALTYDQFLTRTIEYAAAIKNADPSAKTLGPVVNGWTYYWHSPRDGQQGLWSTRPDRMAHGDIPFVPWYLQQMKQYEQTHGVRILDYLDLHYYPQANGVSLSPAGNAATQALRLRSTRSLWDPTYADESWINGTEGGPAVRLIPRMHEWVNANYPGTKLAIGEYNWGALDDLNGALAQADVLGIFGREGLDLATLWDPPASTDPGAFAFRMYRNYDGAGSAFGETGVSASSADQGQLAVYAALRSSDGALMIMVINKSTSTLSSSLNLSGFSPAPAAEVYRYSGQNLNTIVRQPDQAVTAAGFSASFPASAITLFVLLPANPNAQSQRVYLPLILKTP